MYMQQCNRYLEMYTNLIGRLIHENFQILNYLSTWLRKLYYQTFYESQTNIKYTL